MSHRFWVSIFLLAGSIQAQSPPCSRAVITVEGPPRESRFLPAAPERVKASVLRALPAIGAKVEKQDALQLEARMDPDLYQSWNTRNQVAGVNGKFKHGTGAWGSFVIDIQPATENAVSGTRLQVEFRKNKMRGRAGKSGYARPLIQEVACLAEVLSPSDPLQNPTGIIEPGRSPKQKVELPKGTPVKLLLREFLYSRDIKKRTDQLVLFEVAADLVVDGAAVIRRGALGKGKFVDAKSAGVYERSGELAFAIESVTAVDGQSLPVTGAKEDTHGSRSDFRQSGTGRKIARIAFYRGAGFLMKGTEAGIRAGTSYDVEVSETYTVQAGN
jgi:hypothetical protein